MTEDMIKFIKNDRFAQFVGIELKNVKPGYAEAKLKINDNHLNGVDMVHGAAIFSLADYAFAAASNSAGIITVSVNANISYFKSPTGSYLIAKAKEISTSKKLSNYNIDIFDENEELIAKFTGIGYKKSPRFQ